MTEYQPLSLRKDRDGAQYGTVTMFGETFKVKVSSADKRYYHVYVVNEDGGSLAGKVYRSAGLLRRDGSTWRVQSYDADSKSRGNGYTERGTLARNAERVVSEFLSARQYAAQEAAKTPEEREADRQRAREAIQNRKRQQLVREAKALMASLDTLVSDDTMHHAVEDARKALDTLVRNIDSIKMQEN